MLLALAQKLCPSFRPFWCSCCCHRRLDLPCICFPVFWCVALVTACAMQCVAPIDVVDAQVCVRLARGNRHRGTHAPGAARQRETTKRRGEDIRRISQGSEVARDHEEEGRGHQTLQANPAVRSLLYTIHTKKVQEESSRTPHYPHCSSSGRPSKLPMAGWKGGSMSNQPSSDTRGPPAWKLPL